MVPLQQAPKMAAAALFLALCPAAILSSDSAIAFARPLALARLPPLSLVPGTARCLRAGLPTRRIAEAAASGRRACCRPQLRCSTETARLDMDEESEEAGGHGPQVYETHMEDAVYCGANKVEFLRAAFGTFDDIIEVPILRAEPMTADADLSNADELRGKIAVVVRGSSRPTACSFVEKAMRVADAGAVGVVVANTEDSMISPGDSAREGGDVSIPVVGIRSSDVAKLIECEGHQNVSLTFKPISPLTAQQRKHLRALSSIWAKEGRLQEVCAIFMCLRACMYVCMCMYIYIYIKKRGGRRYVRAYVRALGRYMALAKHAGD